MAEVVVPGGDMEALFRAYTKRLLRDSNELRDKFACSAEESRDLAMQIRAEIAHDEEIYLLCEIHQRMLNSYLHNT